MSGRHGCFTWVLHLPSNPSISELVEHRSGNPFRLLAGAEFSIGDVAVGSYLLYLVSAYMVTCVLKSASPVRGASDGTSV